MTLGKTLKKGFVRKGIKGTFLHGTIKQYGNKKGIAQKVIKGKA